MKKTLGESVYYFVSDSVRNAVYVSVWVYVDTPVRDVVRRSIHYAVGEPIYDFVFNVTQFTIEKKWKKH
jgi:hypothetical protein